MRSAPLLFFMLLPLAIPSLGCVRIRQEHSDKRFFVLSVERAREEPGTVLAESLGVRGFRISPRYEHGELVYRKGNLEYASDFYNRFFVGPEILITEETRRWMQNAGVFRHVMGSSGPADFDCLLEGMVTALYGDFRAGPRAVMEIQFFLLDASPVSARILLQKSYRREIAIASADPRRLIEGFNAALQEILTDFEADLRTTLVEK